MSLVRFDEKISLDILQAYERAVMSKHRIVCKKGSNGKREIPSMNADEPEKLKKLCNALNNRFPERKYFIERVDNQKDSRTSKV